MKKVFIPLVLAILVTAASCHKDDNTNPTTPPDQPTALDTIQAKWSIDSVFRIEIQEDGSKENTPLTDLIGDDSYVNFDKSDSVHFFIDVAPVATLDSTLAYEVVGDSIQLSNADTTVTVPYFILTDSTLNTQYPLEDSVYANIFLKK